MAQAVGDPCAAAAHLSAPTTAIALQLRSPSATASLLADGPEGILRQVRFDSMYTEASATDPIPQLCSFACNAVVVVCVVSFAE